MANDLTPARSKQALHDSFLADLTDLKALIDAEPESYAKSDDEKDEKIAHRALHRIAKRHAAKGTIVLAGGIDKEP